MADPTVSPQRAGKPGRSGKLGETPTAAAQDEGSNSIVCAVARHLDTVEVTGSIPESPTQVRRVCPPNVKRLTPQAARTSRTSGFSWSLAARSSSPAAPTGDLPDLQQTAPASQTIAQNLELGRG